MTWVKVSPGRCGECSDVERLFKEAVGTFGANLVSFLAGPDDGWVNGQVLRANGGFA